MVHTNYTRYTSNELKLMLDNRQIPTENLLEFALELAKRIK